MKKMANTRKSFKDLEIEFFTGGLVAVRNMVEAHDIARLTVEKCAASLSERGQDTRALETMITERYGEKGTGKGRTPPKMGDCRTYKVQQVKDSAVFGRIPLETLGLQKEEKCNVSFLSDAAGPYLVIRPGAAPVQGEDSEPEDEDPEVEGEDLDSDF